MPLIETEGVVLQSRNFSESSKILAVFTRNKGMISLLVKGGRKGIKKFPGGLESLNHIDLQYYHKTGRDLQNFKSSDLNNSYQQLRRDLPRTLTALSFAETVRKSTVAEDPNEVLLDCLIKALEALDNQERNPWSIRWKYLLDVCKCLGFSIELDECRQCGSRTNIAAFELSSGGFVCNQHRGEKQALKVVTGEMWGTLRFLGQCSYDVAHRISVSSSAGRQIESLFLQYFRYHIPGFKNIASWKKLPDIYWCEEVT